MRHKDPELMNRIRDFAEGFYLTEGHSPSTTEIGEAVGIARGTAYKYLVAMDERGMISYDGTEIMTEKIERLTATRGAEVYTGSIPCGTPETVEAMVEDYVSLPVSIFSSDEMYSPAHPRRFHDRGGYRGGRLRCHQKTAYRQHWGNCRSTA